jgi:CubicO group peptidase (beta-lactamase class C family)
MNLKMVDFFLVIIICTAGCVSSSISEESNRQVVADGTPVPVTDPDAGVSRKLDEYMTALSDAGRFSGTVHVAKGDVVLLSKGYGMANYEFSVPHMPQTVLPIGSNTKQFTAAAIMKLQEQGRLNLTDPVSKYIPGAPNWKDIRIYNLLNHTSGIPTDGPFLATDPKNLDLSDIIKQVASLPLTFEPGSNYSYSNNGYITLSYIIEIASNISYEEYLKENIFQPLGMNNTGQDNARDVFPNRASGYTTMDGKYIHYDLQNIHNTYGAGCLHSTTDDLFRWERAFHTPGVILSRKSTDAMIENQYGVNVNAAHNLTFIFHGGRNFGFISQTFYVSEQNVSIIYLSNHDRTPMGILAKELLSIIYEKPYSVPQKINRKPIHLTSEKLAEYNGTYEPEYEKSWTFTVYSDGNRLFYDSVIPWETVELFYEGNDTFFVTPESDDSVIFTRNVNGIVDSMKMYTMEGTNEIMHKA